MILKFYFFTVDYNFLEEIVFSISILCDIDDFNLNFVKVITPSNNDTFNV